MDEGQPVIESTAIVAVFYTCTDCGRRFDRNDEAQDCTHEDADEVVGEIVDG